jgi:hypothetical protein
VDVGAGDRDARALGQNRQHVKLAARQPQPPTSNDNEHVVGEHLKRADGQAPRALRAALHKHQPGVGFHDNDNDRGSRDSSVCTTASTDRAASLSIDKHQFNR